ncbi:MAG TPA: hypothetical protein VIF62_18265 [Labilithrix sp.]|jgi:hypothetical protein
MRTCVRSLGELGEDLVFAPERHVTLALAGDGVPLGDLVVERRERVLPSELARAIVIDTTHARDGVLDVAAALRDRAEGKSQKKRALVGDLLVSRLRPYLRQIALVQTVPPRRVLALSTEFYVLAPKSDGDDLAFLLPFLLGDAAQRALAAAQEGGHHPRVPRASLFALRVPHALVRRRARTSKAVAARLLAFYEAQEALASVLR